MQHHAQTVTQPKVRYRNKSYKGEQREEKFQVQGLQRKLHPVITVQEP